MEGLCEDCTTRDIKNQTVIKLAWVLNHQDCLDVLIKSKVHVNMQDEDGKTALMVAAQCGSVRVIDVFVGSSS